MSGQPRDPVAMPAAEAVDGDPAWLAALEAAVDSGALPDVGGAPPEALDRALRSLGARRGAIAASMLRRLAATAPDKAHRKAARLALYRLERSGVSLPPAPDRAPPRPVVVREAERATRAWVSGIDGSGARGLWILVEGGLGGGIALCSLIVSDEVGIVDVSGGPTTRKRLEAELLALRAQPGLPWVETDVAHAGRLVAEALQCHARSASAPPAAFAPWRSALAAAADQEAPVGPGVEPDPTLVDRSAELLDLPELAGWFVDPGAIQDAALALLEARESRLVLSDQLKAEREAAIVDRVIERLFTEEARRRWAGRLRETAIVFRLAGQPGLIPLLEATASAVEDVARSARAVAFVRALVSRGLEVAGEVALGRARLDDVTRAPRQRRP